MRGILAEVPFGAPPICVLIGAIAMVLAVATLGVAVARIDRQTAYEAVRKAVPRGVSTDVAASQSAGRRPAGT